MRRSFVLLALIVFIASFAFAHEGHKHNLLGTVKTLKDNNLELSLKDGGTKTVVLTEKTQIFKGDEKSDRAALVEGVRVSVEVDNKDNAITVKVAAEEHPHQH